jgi:hypothetical protein
MLDKICSWTLTYLSSYWQETGDNYNPIYILPTIITIIITQNTWTYVLNGKMKVYWTLPKLQTMKAPCILNLGTTLRCSNCFVPRERACSTHWIESWIPGLYVVAKRKIPSPARNCTLVIHYTVSPFTDWEIPAHCCTNI